MTAQANNRAGELTAELLFKDTAILGEGAIWHAGENRLYWVDIEGRWLHILDPATGLHERLPTVERIGTVVPAKRGGVLVALQTGIHWMDVKNGRLEWIVNPLVDSSIRFNDGKCDPSGRFWVGSMALDQRKGAAVLYRMDRDLGIHPIIKNVTISNGLAWSADRRKMYYIDTPTGVVQAFDYDDASGDITNGRVVITVPEEAGHPDGMTIDAEGKLWIALWGGFAVGRFDPGTGELLSKIVVPVPNVTSCAFGGRALETLYITTASESMGEEALARYPQSGSLFAARPGVKGVEAFYYEGEA